MRVKKCGDCRYFLSDKEERSQSYGDCVYNPPIVLPSGETKFPRVFSEQVCGKGREKC